MCETRRSPPGNPACIFIAMSWSNPKYSPEFPKGNSHQSWYQSLRTIRLCLKKKKDMKKSLDCDRALSRHRRLWVSMRHSNFPFQLKGLQSREVPNPDELMYTHQNLKLWINFQPQGFTNVYKERKAGSSN